MKVDAIVVLASGLWPNGELSPEYGDRVLAGLALVRSPDCPLLVTTRIVRSWFGVSVSNDGAMERLVAPRLPRGVVWKVVGDDARSTRHEAELLAAALLPDTRRVVVVTGAMHIDRATRTLARIGFDAVPHAAPEVHAHLIGWRWWRERGREFMAWWLYRVRGWA